jgi:hypothetical protein
MTRHFLEVPGNRNKSQLTKISPKGFEKMKLCGRNRNVFNELLKLAPKVFLPDAFSMMALCPV